MASDPAAQQLPSSSGLPQGAWNEDSLREHLLMLISANERHSTSELAALERYLELLVRSSERAAELLAMENKEWRDNANEWRGALDDFIKTTPTISQLNSLKDRVDEHREESRREIATLREDLHRDITRLSEVQAVNAGRKDGVNLSFGALAGVLTAIGTLVAIIVVIVNL